MRTMVIVLFCLFSISPAYATFKIIMKDGKTLIWSNYFEEKDNYCTYKSFGKFCVSKSDVASIKKENESKDTNAITTKERTEAEKKKEGEKGKDTQKLITTKSFTFELKNPNIRISIPELPEIPMEPHPLAATRPDLRFQGSAQPFIVSIRTPTADPGMTAAQCATSLVKSIMVQWGLKESEVSLRKSSDGNTFAMYYPLRMEKYLFLKAHLFSAYGGTHCIEVHITKSHASEVEIKKWLEGFPKAKIESY